VALSITALGGVTTSVVFNLPLKLIFSAPGGELAGHDISLQRLLQELSGLSSLTSGLTNVVARGIAPVVSFARAHKGLAAARIMSRTRGRHTSSR